MYVAPDKMEFRVVFDGRLVDGFAHEDVRNAFQARFGEASTCAVFGKSQAVIKRGLTQEQADVVKARLAELGMDVSIEEVMPVGYGLSLVEEEGGQAMPGASGSSRRQAANDAGPGEGGGTADRHPKNETYPIREIEAAFNGAVDLPRATRREALRLLAAAMLMLAMPLAYGLLALTALRALLWVLFGGRQAYFGLVDPGVVSVPVYLLGASAVGLVTLLIFKPLVARPNAGPKPVAGEPAREQVLFAFVEEIAEAVGASMPDDVVFDTETRVAARAGKGPFAGDFTLTIGLPLVWGMSVRSLAGIVARELCVFADPRRRRARIIARWVDAWFRQRIEEPDRWDAVAERWSTSDWRPLSTVGAVIQQATGLGCRLLGGLADVARRLGEPIASDADSEAERYEIALVGDAAAAEAATTLERLAASRRDVVADLEAALDSGRLVDNLPRMIAGRVSDGSPDERALASAASPADAPAGDVTASPWRPADHAADPPLFAFDGAATGLVQDLEKLSCHATLEWYRAHGMAVGADDLVPLETFESESESLKRATDANQRYFGELCDLPMYLPLPDGALAEKISTGKLVAGLGTLKERYRSVRTEAAGRRDRLYLQREYQRYYQQAAFWADAGSPVDVDTYRLKLATTDPKAIEAYRAEHRKSEKALAEELRSVLDLLGKRLAVGLELARRLAPASGDDIRTLRAAYAAISSTFDLARELDESCLRLELMLGFKDQVGNKPEQQKRLDAETVRNLGIRERIRTSCTGVRDPFKPEVTLDFALPDSPAAGSPDPREVLDDGMRTLRQLERLAFRLRGQMAALALDAERQHGVL